ncbi:tRNA glutamyl-Q(34) synthetase GluQRS [Paenibacillus silvisoli]|uniref:tRNA glutamyl-Q(34) synthetase GluQRS n=1 Tax=Paenibacillus silvisoli TaxID=3110539 RepID=UPI002804B216|nr:tRNA glutamyl-Q(34) synthetase GluQRS [Paenibacillus silvisoli]
MLRRGRFAPTPSGQLHIGNAFSALCAWLQIRQAGGQFVLRIEDIDKSRSRPAFAEQQINDLQWLGLDWDEGPGADGPCAPYVQSSREQLYERALERLRADGRIYSCYCSRADLASIASAPHGLSSEGTAYPGSCRHLTPDERLTKEAGKSPSCRFVMQDEPIRFVDEIMGEQRFAKEELSDFIVKRADGMFSYQLAVTVDDAAMGITDVLRGADLVDSTPRQLALYEALGLKPPRFAHIPLLADAEGNRLSKRDKSLTLASLRADGVSPERLVGMIANLAGWQERLEPAPAEAFIPSFHTKQLKQPMISVTEEHMSWLLQSDT